MFNPIRLVLITLISLFIFSCDENDNPISNTNEIDVDWVLIKMEQEDTDLNHYYFYSIGSFSNSNQVSIENFDHNDGNISFVYNDENFIYDISDSYLGFDCGTGSDYCLVTNYNSPGSVDLSRIIYNQEMNYVTCVCTFNSVCNDIIISTLSPFELIDYR